MVPTNDESLILRVLVAKDDDYCDYLSNFNAMIKILKRNAAEVRKCAIVEISNAMYLAQDVSSVMINNFEPANSIDTY
jgi:hypothetical protein